MTAAQGDDSGSAAGEGEVVCNVAGGVARTAGREKVRITTEGGWRAWMILAVFFAQSAVLTALTGSSFGQSLARIGIVRLDGQRLGWPRALARAAMLCLVVPTVVIGPERRALNGLALGTGRLVEQAPGVARVGRMAVRHDQRGSGIGAALLDALVGVARSRGDAQVLLHAQHSAVGFYARQGFKPRGEPFEEAGIVHLEMTRTLHGA